MSLLRPDIIKQHNPNPVSHQRDNTIQVRSYSRKGEMAGWIGMYISCLKMLHLPLICWNMSPLRVTKFVCEAIHTHTNPWGRLKWPYNQTTDRLLYVMGLHDLTCLTETMQTSLNTTKPQTLNPNRTSKHCEVLIKWTQLNGYVIRKNNLILITEICSEYWSTNRNLVTKITHNIVKTTHISASADT